MITGEIPSWIWEIGNGALYHLNVSSNLLVDLQKPYHIPSFLAELDLHSNQLRGELPLLPQGASYVDFSDNKFNKPIPIDFVSSNFFLIFLSIANNTMSGSIPASICSASTIQVLDFRLNNMSGSIPPCVVESMSNLQVLNLKRNNISGDIPDKFSTSCGLRYFDLSDNNLGGSFPRSLINCQLLEVINVGQNKIEDSFPCMLPSRLRVLMLGSNEFQGELKCGESFPNLEVMDISFNNFSGELHHTSFSSWRKMARDKEALLWRKVVINVVRPDFYYSTSELKFSGIFYLIDLSSNNFRGEIPDAIGDLRSLTYLNLSHNALTGTIPKSLGNMEVLEVLDLSKNQLTGVMPEELTNLNFLGFLDVSYNKLVGKIPLSAQFQSFSSDSFKGNSGLCGGPLSNSCNISSDDMAPLSKSDYGNELSSQTQQSAAHALSYAYVVSFATILSLLCQSP